MPLFKPLTAAGENEAKYEPVVRKNLKKIIGSSSIKAFAESLGINPKDLSNRLSGKQRIKDRWVLEWSGKLSSDNAVIRQLLGIKPACEERPKKKRDHAEKIKSLLLVHDVSKDKESARMGYPTNYLSKTSLGQRSINIFELPLLAEIIGISIEDLIDELF